MDDSAYALLPLLGILAFISNIRNKRRQQTIEKKEKEAKMKEYTRKEARRPSFEIPEQTGAIYRDTLQQEASVWKHLIRLNKQNNWRYGAFESEKYVESIFPLSEHQVAYFRYAMSEGELHFNVVVQAKFPKELATDLFVLAAHLNNLLIFGKVIVNVPLNIVLFSYQNELALYDIYPRKLEEHLQRHHRISKDVYWAFQKYMDEGEEPAFIIADLIKMKNQSEES
jgi:hypothetical protein